MISHTSFQGTLQSRGHHPLLKAGLEARPLDKQPPLNEHILKEMCDLGQVHSLSTLGLLTCVLPAGGVYED